MNKKFALIGVGGFVAPRHLRAIKETGNILVAALDPNDSVGIIDSYFPEADFFTEFERFDRHIEKLRRGKQQKIDYVSICSPNYLHDAHVRFALRIGANAICEKPLVLNSWNLDALADIEKETNCKINAILQLRLHPSIIKLKEQIEKEGNDKIYDIDLTYILCRGKWYDASWKGNMEKSGGVITNIGIHFFDLLIWIFGKVINSELYVLNGRRAGGYVELEKARIRWFLSINKEDMVEQDKDITSCRSIVVKGKNIKPIEILGPLSDKFGNDNGEDLHITSYREILDGRGFGIEDVRDAIEIISSMRTASLCEASDNHKIHLILRKIKK